MGAEVVRLYETGLSIRAVATEVGIHHRDVWRHLERTGVARRPRGTGGVVLSRRELIGVKELPDEVQLPTVLQQTERGSPPRAGVQSLDDVERDTILQALAECHGNKKKAAELLGIQRPTLYNKMKRYAIEL